MGVVVHDRLFYSELDVYIFFFFFSSRRRHTRYWRDWSSDVCSSDLRRTTVPRRCARPPLRCRSNSCPCRATAPISCRLRRSGAGCARTSPTATATAPPRISAAASPPPRRSSIRTPAPSLTASGSKIGSTLRRSEEHTSELQSRQYLLLSPPTPLPPYTPPLPGLPPAPPPVGGPGARAAGGGPPPPLPPPHRGSPPPRRPLRGAAQSGPLHRR